MKSAIDAMHKAAFVLEAYGDHAVTLRNAIAGLTGGEGCDGESGHKRFL